MKTYCIAQGAVHSALWWPKWEGNPEKRGCMYTWPSQVALEVKNPFANAGDIRDAGLIPGLGRSPVGGHDNPLQYSCLENPMDRGAWWAMVHSVTKTCTWLKWLGTHTRLSQADLSQCSIPKMLLGIYECAMKR